MNSLYIKGMTLLTQTAENQGGTEPIAKTFDIILGMLIPLKTQVNVICTIVILVSGLLFMIPISNKYKKMAGVFLASMIFGAILVLGATNYGASIAQKAAF